MRAGERHPLQVMAILHGHYAKLLALDGSGAHDEACLLYTSDAADERSSVDLGGRRIIKKNRTAKLSGRQG